LYLVLYLQDDLGYSALQTGLRLLILSGVTLVAATFSGVFSERLPVRWLIGPGLFLVGLGLLLMGGLHGTSIWTHLIPGFIVAGLGSGLVNPPLASTAVGVVNPQRSGMASGVNTTFRQVGIATGIAAYGSIFASSLGKKLGQNLASTPALHQHLPRIVAAVQQGNVAQLFAATPKALHEPLAAAIHSSFTSTLDILFIVSSCLALVGATCSLALIRSRDFVASHEPPVSPPESEPSPTPVARAIAQRTTP
jgi:hypothetical protein